MMAWRVNTLLLFKHIPFWPSVVKRTQNEGKNGKKSTTLYEVASIFFGKAPYQYHMLRKNNKFEELGQAKHLKL